jgi:hypothetical protein
MVIVLERNGNETSGKLVLLRPRISVSFGASVTLAVEDPKPQTEGIRLCDCVLNKRPQGYEECQIYHDFAENQPPV